MIKLLSRTLLVTVFLFCSCQDILECIINKRPELSDRKLAQAYVNQLYSEKITAGIKNEPLDNSYDYYFHIDGELPEGIEYIINYRDIVLQGRPLSSGTYKFTVRLSAEQKYNYSDDCESNFNDCDGLCDESTSRAYTIIVN
ncbi:hypothetical protein V8G69_11000 [Gaetbulibacter sp. M235]|uniref:hypothetical protein n=1 Tax=Gaetbulibacter sp. M235 TaxID=3126510 RepID=UPI00374F7156